MLKPRHELENWLMRLFANIEDKKEKQNFCMQLEEVYNIPIDMSLDIISMRKDLSEYNEFILFAIVSIVAEHKVKSYFTEREINNYQGQKFKATKIKFPIRIKMIQVDKDQWIGATSAQFLMKLRDAQYINYNADTQRALEAMLKNGHVIYRPSVVYNSVKDISRAYKNKEFIPNTISLNINPDDEDAEFEYNEEELEFVIKTLHHFDIFDGYHRYLGMSDNYDRDKTFDYPMELRITNFSVGKAKQFIFQEMHQNKMRKINANTYDQYNPGNMVIERLNEDPKCNLYNNINLKNGIVNAGELSEIVNFMYFNTTNKIERKDIIRVSKELKTSINEFTEEYEEYLTKKWNRVEIRIIIYGIYNEIEPRKIIKVINQSNIDKKINATKVTKGVVTELKEVFSNV